jgi:replicative DNA helicase
VNVLSNSFFDSISLPNNLLAEKNILAELLLNPVKNNLIFTRLTYEMFYFKEHQTIYKAAYALYNEGLDININTVADRLGPVKLFTDVENISFLLDLTNVVFPFNELETCIVLIIDKYLRRKLISAAFSIFELAKDSSISLETLFDEAETRLLSITQKKPTLGLVPASDVLLESFIDLEKRSENGGFLGTQSGFFDLDNLMQGLQKSDLIIIAGRPSMGKTAFALNIARNVAESQDYPVAIFSLEMSRQQIVYRFLSTESQVMNSKLRSGNISNSEWNSVSQGINILSELKIYLDDTPDISVREIKSKIERLKSKTKDIGLIIVDYLQLLTDISNNDNRVNELSKITRGLKILAREINVPVIVLSQLSRNVESRTNKRPILSDLRESGSIEQDADVVLMLYREDYYDQVTPDISSADVIIAKHRNGPTGTINLSFDSKLSSFSNLIV